MAQDVRHGRGGLALAVYLVLAVVFFSTGLTLLGWLASAAVLASVVDLVLVARRGQRPRPP